MRLTCPQCRNRFTPADINIAEGVAFCGSCGTLTRLSEVADDPAVAGADAMRLPGGCMVHKDGGDTVLFASCRSAVGAGGMLAFAVFWNGMLLTFIGAALRATFEHSMGAAPAWLQNAPTYNADSGWELMGLWLFLSPFMAIGLGLIGGVIMALAGHVEVRLGRDESWVFIGIGPVGWRRRFNPAAAESVTTEYARWQNEEESRQRRIIALHADRTIRFGGMLPKKRRGWLVAALRRELLGRRAGRA